MTYRAKHVVEYALLKGVAGIVLFLPYRGVLLVGWCLAAFIHWVCRYRVEMARERIREVFGEELAESEVKRVAWISFRNMCFVAIEMFWMPRLSLKWVEAHVSGLDSELLKPLYHEGRGFIVASPHFGNWEVMGSSLQLLGYPVFYLYREQSNPLTDRFIRQRRECLGAQTVSTNTVALRAGIKLLRKGLIMGLLPDLRVKTAQTPIPYLGKQANLGRGAAMFARSAKSAILPAVCRRVGWAQFEVTTWDPIVPDDSVPKEEDWERMTRELMRVLSEVVMDSPDQYFWFNKRWVLEPLADERP